MIEAGLLDSGRHAVTDGNIAVINLENSRRRSWDRLVSDPMRPLAAERIVEEEQMACEFLGDVDALDRLEGLAMQVALLVPASARTALLQAQVASTTHRFADARRYLEDAARNGAPSESVENLTLNIDQACGARLDAVLEARRRRAAESNGLEDLVPLGALLADLHEFVEADEVYRHALRVYGDVSPFGPAWVCFQLGVLWGELVAEPQTERAAHWYRKAIACVPAYVKARVHLAEIHLRGGKAHEAEALLRGAAASGDPEVPWRLAEVLASNARFDEAEGQLAGARSEYESLLDKHLLAFADHAAEFYAGSGNDLSKALCLARANADNRPTLRAFEQAHAIAVDAGETIAAAELLASATRRWGATNAFRQSSLAADRNEPTSNGDHA